MYLEFFCLCFGRGVLKSDDAFIKNLMERVRAWRGGVVFHQESERALLLP